MVGILIWKSVPCAYAGTFGHVQPARSGRDDGRAGTAAGAHDVNALGETFHAGGRRALESVLPCRQAAHGGGTRPI